MEKRSESQHSDLSLPSQIAQTQVYLSPYASVSLMQTEGADENNLETQNDSGSGLGEQPDQAKRPRKDGTPQSNAQDIENDSEHLQLQLETITALPVIAVATGFWYFSSSINAVASQRLFRGLLQESTMLLTTDDDDRVIENWGVIVLSVVLTLGQLCAGSLLSLPVLFLLGREPRHSDRMIGCRGNNTKSTSAMPKNQVRELYQ